VLICGVCYDEDEDGVITIMEPEELSRADGAA
jgi:hypothetical protein